MNEKEKLSELMHSADLAFMAKGIEIIENAMNEDLIEKIISRQEFIADHLLANGVIVPPCKVGDKIYIIGDNLAEDVRRDKPIEVEVEGFIFDRGNKIVKIVFWESWLGKFIPIENWNKTAFATFEEAEKALRKEDEGGKMKTVCNGCEFLSIDEEEQDLIKNQGGGIYPHICRKYKKQVRHYPYSEPYIYPCDECLNNHPTEKGGAEE